MLGIRGCFLRNFEDLLSFSKLSLSREVVLSNSTRKAHSRSERQKTLHPIAVRNTNRKRELTENLEQDVDLDKIKQEFRRDVRNEFRRTGGMDDNVFEAIDKSYNDMARDHARLSQNMKRDKMFRKHFRPYFQKEVNLLTYAEKEKIRFLYKSNPDEWTPEALATSFPVSPEGAYKIIKSSFRARNPTEVKSHDDLIADKIQMIKSGEIPMTAELKIRMEMRDKIPIKIGFIDPNDKNLINPPSQPKEIGEFQSLVTLRQMPTENKMLTAYSDEIQTSGAPIFATFKDNEDPDMGDYYIENKNYKVEKVLRQSKVKREEEITFNEFTRRLKEGNNSNGNAKEIKNPEISYLQSLPTDKPVVTPTRAAEIKIDMDKDIKRAKIRRFKESPTDQPEIKSEYNVTPFSRKAGYKNTETEFDDRNIDIPDNIKRQDAIYRKGKSFYDENGEFMYRVV